MKKVIIGLALIILASGTTYFGYQRISKEKFACSYPAFTRIEKGITSIEVTKMLGEPDQKIVKDSLGGNRFGQGDLELQIKSGWLYDLPDWDGNLEIYFDLQDNVVGKNCGHG